MIDEYPGLRFDITKRDCTFQENMFLHRLVPTLNCLVGLRLKWCATDVIHPVVLKTGDTIDRCALVVTQPRLVYGDRVVVAVIVEDGCKIEPA